MTLADQPWTAIRDLLAAGRKVAVLLPCGATEAHGPHLPLNTDVIISEGIARRAADRLNAGRIGAFVLPALSYAPTEYAAAFAGTVGIGAAAAKLVLMDIARNLKLQGFACLGLANSHFDPANVTLLRDFAVSSPLPVAFPDFTRRLLAQKLTEEFQSGACHAGQFETSLVMADRPDLIREEARLALEPNPSSLTAAFANGARTFAEAGGPDAYFGDPAQASAEEGHKTFDIMAELLAEEVRKVVDGR